MNNGEFTELDDLVRNYVIDRWQLGDRTIDSEHIYNDLIAAGVCIPDRAMHKVLKQFQNEQMIQATHSVDAHALTTHGGALITWVDTTAM